MPVLKTLASASAKSLGQVKNTSKNYLVSVSSTEDGDPVVNKTVFHLDPIIIDGTNTAVAPTANNYAIPSMSMTISGRPFMGTFGPLSDLGYSLAITSYTNVGPGANTTGGAPSVTYSGSHSRWDLGANDFTIEFWMYVDRLDIARAGTDAQILSSGTVTSNGTNFAVTLLTNNQIRFFNNALGPVTTSATNAFRLNTWHHVLIARSGNTITMYVDGKATGSTSGSVTGSTIYGGNTLLAFNRILDNSAQDSSAFKGFISNCRIVKGQALVNGNFTPSTVPITDTVIGHTGVNVAGSITGTVTTWFTNHGSMSSFSGPGIEPANVFLAPRITAFTPFYKDTAANANVKATTYSLYNDGVTQLSYVETANVNTNFRYDRAFTIEGWCYLSANSGAVTIFENGLYTDGILFRAGTLTGDIFINNVNRGEANAQIFLNQWFHYAFTRDRANISNVYINGKRIANATVAGNINNAANPIRIGDARHTTNQSAFAHHSQVRIVNGDAVYSGNFIPPALAPLQLDGANSAACYSSTANVSTTFSGANTVLLLKFDNPSVIDKTGNMNIAILGNARPKKFGPHANALNSIYIDGSAGARLEVKSAGNSIPLPLEWTSNAGSLVGRIDFWVYPLTLTTGNLPTNQAESILSIGQNYLNIGIYNNFLRLYTSQNTTANTFITGSRIVPVYQWSHVSVIFTNNDGDTNARIIQDGFEVARGNIGRVIWAHTISGNAMVIGAETSNPTNSAIQAFISDLRITHGDSRINELTVPNGPYPHYYSGASANVINSSTGNLTSSQAEVLIVAGGGGGGATAPVNTGNTHASGAGGGGILHTQTLALQKGTYTIVVGAGGARSQYGSDNTQFNQSGNRPRQSTASNGSNSYIITPDNVTYTAIGGGRGVGSDTNTPANGGSGGGGNVLSGTFGVSNQNSIPPFIGYGNNGNAGNIYLLQTNGILVSGGGGGAGAPGGNNFNTSSFTGSGPFTPGAGGDGRPFFTDGLNIPIYYGGGGAGSAVSITGATRLYGLQPGGQGGGAYTRNTETYSYLTQYDGEPNSGGGGAGITATNNNTTAGGAGGSGVVIIRYPDQYPRALSTTGRVVYRQSKGSHIYKFLSTGTITF